MKLLVGQRISSYVVADLLGEGGTSEVYLVHRDNQSFALKLLKDEHRRNAVQQARLVNEAEALRVLDIPGVVQVFGDGDFEGRPYYVMEYLPTTLAERIGKPLLPSQIVPVIEMLARILAELHARGYVHRDLKPRNILFAPDGSLRLADFGLAKLPIDQLAVVPHSTATGAFLGTHAYAAPEQLLNAKSVDGRADVYALGLILFEALAGRPPFPAENAEELAHLRLTTRAPRLLSPLVTLSPQLVSLVAQMLERAHDRRPSAHEVLERLASVPLTHAPTLPRRRFAALLMLPLFLSDPFADMFREKPDARVAEPLSAHPHEVAPPQTAKELFAAFGIALDAGTMEEASALLLRAESLPVTPELEGKLLQKQADMARELGQLNQAQQLYRKARQHFLQPNSLRNWAACAIREADMWLHLGDMDAARELYEEAAHYHSVVLAKKDASRGDEVHLALFHLGLFFLEQRLFDRAHDKLILAKASIPETEAVLLARTEERLASLPGTANPLPLLESAIERTQRELKANPHSRRAQVTRWRAEHQRALLLHDEHALNSLYTQLRAAWSTDKSRGTIAHDYLELLLEGIAAFPARMDWKTQARSVMVELEARAQWQGDVHLAAWKKRLDP